ncbi:hypothetical protein ACFL59_15495, partial [Planctomycetota bacterium]
MALDSYLFEKACFVPAGLSRLAEDLRLLPADSPASRETGAFLNVALRHGLLTCCGVAGAEFQGGWVVDISREGSPAWEGTVKPALEDAIFGPDERDERLKASGLPRDHAPDAEPHEVDAVALVPQAAKCLAALLDLTGIVRRHGCLDLEDGRFRSHLGYAFNGATKVIATLIDAEWDVEWPGLLVDHDREALDGVLAKLREADEAWRLPVADLSPLNEAWLAEVDPLRTPEAEQEAERQRRASITKKTRMPHDLAIPKRYRST